MGIFYSYIRSPVIYLYLLKYTCCFIVFLMDRMTLRAMWHLFYLQALVECDGDSIDLSGDVGSVGRVVIADDSSEKHEMLLDLKGMM